MFRCGFRCPPPSGRGRSTRRSPRRRNPILPARRERCERTRVMRGCSPQTKSDDKKIKTGETMTQIISDSADRSRLRVILAASIGSALEWYDFFLYGTAAALVFGELFFPKSDPVVGTLLAFLTFGVGFVVRPLGGILFGIMGDRFGRKPVLVATLLM